MKTTLTVLFIASVALLIYCRQRIYLRDPIATVYCNDVQQTDVEVFINYSNDVLLDENDGEEQQRILVQDWNRKPGTPERLTCLRWIACLTEADEAPSIPLSWTGKGKYDPKVFMTTREVTFVDGNASAVRIELR